MDIFLLIPRKFSIEELLDPRSLPLPTIGLHHMEGRFLHLLTLLKIKFPLDWSPRRFLTGTDGPYSLHQVQKNPSGSKPMPTFEPSDLIGRTFVLPPEENGERHRAEVTRQVVQIIDQHNGQRVENINFILDIGNGKVEELISYNQLLEHLENAQDNDMGMDQELYMFRAIIGHQDPLLASDPDWKGS